MREAEYTTVVLWLSDELRANRQAVVIEPAGHSDRREVMLYEPRHATPTAR